MQLVKVNEATLQLSMSEAPDSGYRSVLPLSRL